MRGVASSRGISVTVLKRNWVFALIVAVSLGSTEKSRSRTFPSYQTRESSCHCQRAPNLHSMIATDINSYGENDHIVETEFVGQLEHLFAISHFVHAARPGIQNRVPSLYDRPTTYSAPSGLKLILNGCSFSFRTNPRRPFTRFHMRIVLSAPTDKASLFEGCTQIDVTDALGRTRTRQSLVASKDVKLRPLIRLPNHDFPIRSAADHKLGSGKLKTRNVTLVEEDRSVLFGFLQVEDANRSIHVLSSTRIDSSAPPERR